MKDSIDVYSQSSDEWIQCVLNDFDEFLKDHADCERKASGMALSLVAKYPDKTEIIPDLIATAVEELEHFEKVYAIMNQKKIQLNHSIKKDPYVNELLNLMNSGLEERFLDRLLLGSVVECRGAERFKKVADALEDKELKSFYKMLWASEAKHGDIFVKFALKYFPENVVYKRLDELLTQEASILNSLKIRPALH